MARLSLTPEALSLTSLCDLIALDLTRVRESLGLSLYVGPMLYGRNPRRESNASRTDGTVSLSVTIMAPEGA